MSHEPFNETEVMVAEITVQERVGYYSDKPRLLKISPVGRHVEVPEPVQQRVRLEHPVYRVTTHWGPLWIGQRKITDQLAPLYSLYTRHGDEVFRAPLLCLVKAYVMRTF
jgi:hypothetical protein